MPVEFKHPAGLWWLLLLVPLVILYILKIRRQRRRIGSVWLWAAAERDLLAQSPFRRLVPQVPLFLQMLAVILLSVALARPAWRGGTLAGDHVAIVVDTSASMAAKNPSGRTRLEQAKARAAYLIQRLAPGAEAMIIQAGAEPHVLAPLDRDKRRLERALSSLAQAEVEGAPAAAVALAAERLRRLSGERRIVLLTDGVSVEGDLSTDIPLSVEQVGVPIDNAGIVRIDIRGGYDPVTRVEQVQAFAAVVNHGDKPRDLFVTLRQRNVREPLASRKIRLAPKERAPVVLTFEPTPGDRGTGLMVELSPRDALPVDDRAYGTVPAGRKLPVVVVPPTANSWIKRALAADPEVELMGATLNALLDVDVPSGALLVLDGVCPASTPGGDLLILNPPPGPCRTATVGKALESPTITSWTDSDQRLRFLTLDDVQISKARVLETDGQHESLVNTTQGTVVADVSSPGRTGTLVGFDVGESNWPLKASFVLFVRNVVELARAHRAQGVTGPGRTGAPLRLRVPPDVAEVALLRPDASTEALRARHGLVVVPTVNQAGFYHLSWQGKHPDSTLVVANLASELESRATPRDVDTLQAGAARATPADRALTEYGWLLAGAALVFVALDAWWLTREGSGRVRRRRSAPGTTKPRTASRPRRAASRSAA